jgi:hypothetical protein
MNRIVRFLAVTASVGAAATVLSFTSAGPALAQTFKPVMSLIVNDAAHPVPVVDVGARPPAAVPFQHDVTSVVPESLSLVVPADKRLVIDFYSGTVNGFGDCPVDAMGIRTIVSNENEPGITRSLLHRLLAVPVLVLAPSQGLRYTVSQLVHLTADPGTRVEFEATTTNNCPVLFFGGVVSGHLIPVS